MSFKVELEGFKEFEADLIKVKAQLTPMGEAAMWESVRLLEAEAKAIVPHKTGRLGASIGARVETQLTTITGEVGTNVEYARPIEFGQKPHYIAGREVSAQTGRTKLLKFELGGQIWFKQWVYHTGSRAYEFLGGALDNSRELIIGRFKDVQDRVIDILKD